MATLAHHATPRRRRAVVLCTPAALLLVLLAACADPEVEPTAAPTQTTSETPTESSTPSEEPTQTPEPNEVSVYYMVDSRAGLRLIPERHDVSGDAVQGAVEQMIAGPTDPDYTSPWNPATQVLGVTPGDTVVVDLSADARTATIGSEGAALMIQQLVHTASAAAGDETAAVLLLIEGQPAGELWGVVEWTQPVGRDDPLGVQYLTQIDVPREGATTTSPVTVSGQAAAFEANVPWRVLNDAGTEVASGFTMTSEGMTFAPYSFTVDLEPGTYTIVVDEDDPSGGEGGARMTDTRTVTVVE